MTEYRSRYRNRSNQSSLTCDCEDQDLFTDERTGDTICRNCGLVVADRSIDQGKEWRSYTRIEENSKARTGAPTSLMIPDKGLTTRVGWLKKGTPEQIARSKRLQKTNRRNRGTNIERNLKKAFEIMRIVCGYLKINDVSREKGTLIYREAVKRRLSRGRPMDALVCASLFVGCKQKGTPKPLEDFRRFADEKQIKNCIALLSDEMGININASKPIAFIQEIAEKGCISDEARVKAYKILNALKNTISYSTDLMRVIRS